MENGKDDIPPIAQNELGTRNREPDGSHEDLDS